MQILSTILNKVKKQAKIEQLPDAIYKTVYEIEEILRENETLTGENKQLEEKNKQLTEENKKLLEELEKVMSENNKMKNQLKLNSQNSSKPPSTDGYNKKKKVTNSRNKTNRKTGGQEGHTGVTLEKLENPDEVIDIPLTLEKCDCGCSLTEIEDETVTRQIFDILMKLFVTEYVIHIKRCPCGKVHSSKFPADVQQPVEYSDNVKAFLSLLTMYHFIPLERATEIFKDLFGVKPSEGTVVNTNKKLYDILEVPVNKIKEQIKSSPVVHFDESGFRDNALTKWMHVASTVTLTYYEMNQNRGFKGAKEVGILPDFTGTAVHDHWKPYYKFTLCTHSECNSHILRYLRDIYENYGQEWAQSMASLLLEIKDKVQTYKDSGETCMSKDECESWLSRYHSVIDKGYIEDEQKSPYETSKKTGKKKNSKARLLLNRMDTYDIEHLAFMFGFDIPFDNNLSERDLRMQKLRQKISGSFRGVNGANVFCRIRSYISTARKNGLRAYDAIQRAFAGNPFIPKLE